MRNFRVIHLDKILSSGPYAPTQVRVTTESVQDFFCFKSTNKNIESKLAVLTARGGYQSDCNCATAIRGIRVEHRNRLRCLHVYLFINKAFRFNRIHRAVCLRCFYSIYQVKLAKIRINKWTVKEHPFWNEIILYLPLYKDRTILFWTL